MSKGRLVLMHLTRNSDDGTESESGSTVELRIVGEKPDDEKSEDERNPNERLECPLLPHPRSGFYHGAKG